MNYYPLSGISMVFMVALILYFKKFSHGHEPVKHNP